MLISYIVYENTNATVKFYAINFISVKKFISKEWEISGALVVK